MSTRNETTRRDKASAKLAATKKEKKKKEPITDTRPAYAIAEIYDANYILCSLYSLSEESFLKISSDITVKIIAAFTCKLRKKNLKVTPIAKNINNLSETK